MTKVITMPNIIDIHTDNTAASERVLINDTSIKNNKRWIACLLDVAKNSDRQSYFYLYEFFAPKLKSFLMQRGTSQEEAEELIQETFITVWQKANYYSATKAYVSTWIFTIARNKRLDRARKNIRHMNYLNTLDTVDPDFNSDGPFEFTANLELMNSIQQLPEPQPQILKAVYFEGKSHQATADELNITLGTVKGQIRSALNRLRNLIKTTTE